MSYTEIFAILPSGEVVPKMLVANSFRGAFLFWENMRKRFRPELNPGAFLINQDAANQIWSLARDKWVPVELRLVMQTTFDGALVAQRDMLRIAECMECVPKYFDDPGNLLIQAKVIRDLLQSDTNLGCAWNQTTVNADSWTVPDPESEGEARPYNVLKDSGRHFWVQVELNA